MIKKRGLWIYNIIQKTMISFSEARAAQAAAGMAYYAIFSLFPLMLLFIALGSFVLESEHVYQQILNLVGQTIPVSQQLIEGNLKTVLVTRSTVGLLGIAGLAWSASGVFSGLAYNINLAWSNTKRRNFLRKRLIGFAMMGVIFALFLASLVFEAIAKLFANQQVPLSGSIELYATSIWTLMTNMIPWLIVFVLHLGLYHWIPATKVKWTAAIWGALGAATAWKLATSGFVWYLESGLGRYEVIYGSLGAVLALMFLIYLISTITLFCAHLSANIQFAMES